MYALKLIAQDSIKADAPQFKVGDTVKVHVKIREGEKNVSRYSREQLLLARAVA